MKEVGKTTRPFKYDLNQIPNDYAVEVTNGFEGLDLIECLMNYGQGFVTCTGDRDQDHPQGKEMQKSKIAVKRREVKSKGEKERYTHLNAEFQRIARLRLSSSAISAKK